MNSKSKFIKDHSFNPTFKGFRSIEVIFFLFVGLFCFAVQVGAESLQYQEARERFEKGEFLLAMLAAQKAVEESSENAAYRHLYGAILLELKQHSEGEINLRKAVELDPDNAEFLYTLADLLITQKSDVAIRKELRTGIGQPRFGNVDQEGVEMLKRAIELNPDHFKARHRLGRAYTDLNQHDLALEQFRAIADKNPALTYAASSTPGGTRLETKSRINFSSPAGGSFRSSTRPETCSADRGLGGIPNLARSVTCSRYASNTKISS